MTYPHPEGVKAPQKPARKPLEMWEQDNDRRAWRSNCRVYSLCRVTLPQGDTYEPWRMGKCMVKGVGFKTFEQAFAVIRKDWEAAETKNPSSLAT